VTTQTPRKDRAAAAVDSIIFEAVGLAVDMAVTTPTPPGHGHVYAPADYVDAWRLVTAPNDWNDETLSRLKAHLTRELASAAEQDGHEAAYGNRGG
jgi:hypothetical protein